MIKTIINNHTCPNTKRYYDTVIVFDGIPPKSWWEHPHECRHDNYHKNGEFMCEIICFNGFDNAIGFFETSNHIETVQGVLIDDDFDKDNTIDDAFYNGKLFEGIM